MFRRNLPKTVLLAHLALLITNLIWGAAGPVIKYTLQYVPTYTLLFLRFLIVCVILLPITLIEVKKAKINRKDYLNLFLLGLFSQTSLAIVFVSLEYTTALDATLIGILGSIITVYAGHYFYKEKVDKMLKYGLIIASIGTLLVTLEPILSTDPTSTGSMRRLFGNFLALAYTLPWIIYIIWSKMSMGERSIMFKKTLSFIHLRPMITRYSPILIAFLNFYIGLITILPLALLEYAGAFGPHNFLLTAIDPRGLTGLLYLAFLSSIAAYTLNQWALEKAHVSDIAIYGYLGPIFAFPVAYFLLGEVPTPVMWLGCIVIAIGVVVAEKRKS